MYTLEPGIVRRSLSTQTFDLGLSCKVLVPWFLTADYPLVCDGKYAFPKKSH